MQNWMLWREVDPFLDALSLILGKKIWLLQNWIIGAIFLCVLFRRILCMFWLALISLYVGLLVRLWMLLLGLMGHSLVRPTFNNIARQNKSVRIIAIKMVFVLMDNVCALVQLNYLKLVWMCLFWWPLLAVQVDYLMLYLLIMVQLVSKNWQRSQIVVNLLNLKITQEW